MNWTHGIVYGFDTETTGIDVHHDRIVTAAITKIDDGHPIDQRTWLINPGVEIPEAATAVHGITTGHAREHGQDPATALDQITELVAEILTRRYPLVVMNAAFDLSILHNEARRHHVATVLDRTRDWSTLIDPLVIVRGLDTMRRDFAKGRRYRLPDMCARFGVPFTESHDATADATGAALLAIAALRDEPDLLDMTPDRLFTTQQTWRRHDQARFREWVKQSGRQDEYGDIDTGWPLHTHIGTTERQATA